MSTRKSTREVVPQALQDAVGVDFMARLEFAFSRPPMSERAAMILADGPQISGGLDIDPDDIE